MGTTTIDLLSVLEERLEARKACAKFAVKVIGTNPSVFHVMDNEK
jgi:hypothetical protein